MKNSFSTCLCEICMQDLFIQSWQSVGLYTESLKEHWEENNKESKAAFAAGVKRRRPALEKEAALQLDKAGRGAALAAG
ncbi:hypothetical protein C1H46_018457 [Malus baccata]|uniref:Uncharacterized protein n=1 Tax=Malus baccata TaxID=106549 RepID=A0A540MB60_MALBA|nr:hypothetical protein C1H46_018457 [Malus baccata]